MRIGSAGDLVTGGFDFSFREGNIAEIPGSDRSVRLSALPISAGTYGESTLRLTGGLERGANSTHCRSGRRSKPSSTRSSTGRM